MRKSLIIIIASALLCVSTANATVYHFSFETTDGVFTVSGNATTANTLDSAGGYDVFALTGTVSGPGGGSISLIANHAPPAAFNNGSWIYDNVLFPHAAPFVDNPGLLFSAGGSAFNWYSVGSQTYLSSNASAGAYNPGELIGSVSLNTPEPSTWAMMLIGFAGLGLAGYRASRRAAVAA
jgi:PEP-CTERM motif